MSLNISSLILTLKNNAQEQKKNAHIFKLNNACENV